MRSFQLYNSASILITAKNKNKQFHTVRLTTSRALLSLTSDDNTFVIFLDSNKTC